jgi:hypothetical protein
MPRPYFVEAGYTNDKNSAIGGHRPWIEGTHLNVFGYEDSATALRRAQLLLLEDPRFAHPFNWSPFPMIKNWL